MLLMTAFTVLLAPSVVHAANPTFQTWKVLTTDASGNSVSARDLQLGDNIRIVVRVSVSSNGPPRIVSVSSSFTLSVNGINDEDGKELPLMYPTAAGNLVDFPQLPSADKDNDPNTGDLVFGYTILAADKISEGLTLFQTSTAGPISIPSFITDAGTDNASTDRAPPRAGVADALLAIRADGSRVRPPPAPATVDEPPATVDEPVQTRRRIIYQCPVGWVRSTVFGDTKKAMIYEVKVDVDLTNRVSIYKLKSLAIYVHPNEGLETLDGWHLATGILYNHDHENKFHLTAENSVIDEHGFAHIQNPDAMPIRMETLGFIGQSLPSFDYRLYDDKGVRVDFGVSCYKEGGLTWRLWNTKDPRVVRMLPLVESEDGLQEMLKDLNWDSFFYRSEWTVPIMPDLPAAPFAPSKPKGNVVGAWAALKKQKN